MNPELLQQLDNQSITIMQIARSHARLSGSRKLETEHVAAALMFVTTSVTPLLEASGMPRSKHLEAIPREHLTSIPQDENWACSAAVEQIVWDARENANRLRHRLVEPLHLLYSFLEWSDSDGRLALGKAGIDLTTLKRRTNLALKIHPQDVLPPVRSVKEEAAGAAGKVHRTPKEITPIKRLPPTKVSMSDWFSDECKRLLAVAHGRARERKRQSVSLDDLFIGLLKSPETVACQVIAKHANLDRLEVATENFQRQDTASESSVFSIAAMHLLKGAHERALGELIKPEHILLVLLDQHRNDPLAKEFPLPMDDVIIQKVKDTLYDELGLKSGTMHDNERTLSGGDLASLHAESVSSTILITSRLQRVLAIAKCEAAEMGQVKVEPEHLAIACILEAQITETTFVDNREFDFQLLRSELEIDAFDRYGTLDHHINVQQVKFSDEAIYFIAQSSKEAERIGSKIADLNHLVMALLCGREQRFANLLEANKIVPSLLRRRLDYCWSRQASQVVEGLSLDLLDLTKTSGDSIVDQVQLPPRRSSKFNLFSRLSQRSKNLLKFSGDETRQTGRDFVGLEELFMGFLAQPGIASDVIAEYGIDLEETRHVFSKDHCRGKGRSHGQKLKYSEGVALVFGKAHELARQQKLRALEPELILLAMLRECRGVAAVLFEALDIDADELAQMLEQRMREQPGP